ncbi:UNVERIFIED_CONTAM: hypothetical protein FKN15_076800 [Acipenser sinensis]
MEVKEDASIGTLMGSVIAADPDATKSLVRYSIDRLTDLDRMFNIHSGNGSIITFKHLDRESFPWHNITVTATEISNPKQVGRVPVHIRILDINDNAPEFATFYETFVCENAKAGQRIQTVSAVDNDDPIGGHKFFFSLPAEASVNANFTVRDNKDNTAGILTRRSGFSRLERSTYLVPVVISDGGYPMQSSTSTLTILSCLRDNIVSYNDEGGGEEDTQAFDIGTLRNPEAMDDNKLRRDIIPETLFPSRRTAPTRDNADVRDFINQRLQENDTDPTAPPYDSLATYAYEGNGSIAESLSSLESATTEGDQDYNYLSDWGPRFKKLADMYGGEDSDKDS